MTDMSKAGVSVIMPAYNAEKTIKAAIGSVLAQTHGELELIVIDDCSTDSTAKKVKQYTDSRVKLISNEKNSGVSASRNHGIKEAKYDLVAFLDSDDCWECNKLEIQLGELENNPEAAVSFTATAYMDAEGNRLPYTLRAPERVTYREVLKQNVISCSSALVKKEMLLRFPMLNDRGLHEDLALWLNILKVTPYAVGTDMPLLIYRVSPTGKSGNKVKAARMQWKTYRACKVPFFLGAYSFVCYAVRNIIKYKKIKSNKSEND